MAFKKFTVTDLGFNRERVQCHKCGRKIEYRKGYKTENARVYAFVTRCDRVCWGNA